MKKKLKEYLPSNDTVIGFIGLLVSFIPQVKKYSIIILIITFVLIVFLPKSKKDSEEDNSLIKIKKESNNTIKDNEIINGNNIVVNKNKIEIPGISILLGVAIITNMLFSTISPKNHNASSSPQASSKIVRSSSKIVQSSSQTQISSQTGNNNAKVVINNGQNGEVNGNNFYGPGQAVQTNSTKNVQINSNNFYQ